MNSTYSVFRVLCLISIAYLTHCLPTSTTVSPKKSEEVTIETKTEETQLASATDNQPVSSDQPEKQQSDSKANPEQGSVGKGHMFEYAYSMSHDSSPFTASSAQPQGSSLNDGSAASPSNEGARAAPRNPVEFSYHQQYHPQPSSAYSIPTEYYGPKSSEQLEEFFKQMFPTAGETRSYQPSEQKDEKSSNGEYNHEMTQPTQNYPQTYPYVHGPPHGPPHGSPHGPPQGGYSGYNPPNYNHYSNHPQPPPHGPNFMNNIAHNEGPHSFGGHNYPKAGGDNKAKLIKMNVGKQNNNGNPWGSKTTYVYRDPKKPGNFMEITEMNVAVNKDGSPDMADPSSRGVGGMFNHYQPYGPPSGSGPSGPHSPGSYSYYEGPYGGAEPHEPPEPFF